MLHMLVLHLLRISLPVCNKFPCPSIHHHPPLLFLTAMHLDHPCIQIRWHNQFERVYHTLFVGPTASSPCYKDRNANDSRSIAFFQHFCTQRSCLYNL